jgi:hypothetical protein
MPSTILTSFAFALWLLPSLSLSFFVVSFLSSLARRMRGEGSGERPPSSRRLNAGARTAWPDDPGVGGEDVAVDDANNTEGADVVEAELNSVY